jgi:phage-related minor tail protein
MDALSDERYRWELMEETLDSYAKEAKAATAHQSELLEVLKDFVLDHDNGLGPSVERLRDAIKKAEAP